MRFPSIRDVRAELTAHWRRIRLCHYRADLASPGDDSPSVDVRLQVEPSGEWAIHTGPSDYDQDHRGFWGASRITWDRQNLAQTARELIDQARDDAAMSQSIDAKAVAFFHEHAGYSHGPNETAEEGRARCAREMAKAEAWARDNGVRFSWEHESVPADRSGIEHNGPLWSCCAWMGGKVVASCGMIDLGATGTPYGDPYGRVMEADLATQAKETI